MKPRIDPATAATLLAQLPARLRKKLDAEPHLADGWTWTPTTVTTDKGETVTLTLDGDVVIAVACSCLLGPRCLHVAAVVSLLEPAEPAGASPDARPDTSTTPGATATAPTTGASMIAGPDASMATGPEASPTPGADTSTTPTTGASPTAVSTPLTATSAPVTIALAEPRAAAARLAFQVAADVLVAGAESAGTFAQAELLRAIHACRTEALHRLAAGLVRVLRSVRDLRADRPEASLGLLHADLRDTLLVAHDLGAGTATATLLGSARRDYESVGNLRLHGIATEAIVARTGYAGAVTYLVDDRGHIYSRADVAPGDTGRAAGAYDAAANVGDAVLPHRELCRSGLFVSSATASADGRLGAGKAVRAVRASEPSRWDADPLAARFSRPLAAQVAALAAHDTDPDALRPAGWDLIFLDGTLLGGSPRGVVLAVANVAGPAAIGVVLTTAHDHRLLAARDNLAALARAPGLRVRVIGRARLSAPRRLELLAIGPAPGELRFDLPAAWHGRANLHYDRLTVAALSDPPVIALEPPPPHDDLLEPLRRRVQRVALGGSGTLPTHAVAELDREAAALADRALVAGASVLRDLAALAHDAARSATGARKQLDRTTFACAWLRAALYEDAARRKLSLAAW